MMEVHALDDYYLAITLLITIGYQLFFFSIAYSLKFDKLTGMVPKSFPYFDSQISQTLLGEQILSSLPLSPSHSPAIIMPDRSSTLSSSWFGALVCRVFSYFESSRPAKTTDLMTRGTNSFLSLDSGSSRCFGFGLFLCRSLSSTRLMSPAFSSRVLARDAILLG